MASNVNFAGGASSNSAMDHVYNDPELVQKIRDAKILLVGAGGIGCEVIKTLLLLGFTDVDMIDLDTIDVSNLNRQFLFDKSHVQKSKAEVAAQVAIKRFAHTNVVVNGVNKSVEVRPIHGSIQQQQFGVEWFQSYTLVINALDNRAARSHVNRMCLVADVPLIESGSEGYMGQVFLIKNKVSACYECDGIGKDQRTYASCTIRNTPSLPIHCIVWGKHLFAQLFGEYDADNDVSPDAQDPELNENDKPKEPSDTENQEKQSTRDWAQKVEYDTSQLFDKFFNKDVAYLLKMDKLWEKRKKPTPLELKDLLCDKVVEATGSKEMSNTDQNCVSLKDQRLWTLKECYTVFTESVANLKARLSTDQQFLVWDKDDEDALNFVTAVSNLRSFCFAIERKSKFDVKSMAGNIIPAIASTNSVVGGLIGLQALQVLRQMPKNTKDMSEEEKLKFNEDLFKACRIIYLRKVNMNHRNLVAGYELYSRNPKCLVCATERPEVEITLNLKSASMSDFVEQIIISKLHFVCPDVSVDGTPTLLYSKDDEDDQTEEEKETFSKKPLADYPFIANKTRLKIDDLLQNQTIIITLIDEEIDPARNDGLFFKFKVLSGEIKKEEDGSKESENNTAESEEGVNSGEASQGPPVLDKQEDDDLVEVTGYVTKIQTNVIVAPDNNGKVSEVAEDSDSDIVYIDEVIDLSSDDNENDVVDITENKSKRKSISDPGENGHESKRLRTDSD